MGKNKWRLFSVILFALAITFGSCSHVEIAPEKKAVNDDSWKFHTIVDVNFVKQYAKVPQPEGVMIVDSRPYKPKYIQGHIPTAVNIPDSQFDKKIDMLPGDKATMLIFYCEGPT